MLLFLSLITPQNFNTMFCNCSNKKKFYQMKAVMTKKNHDEFQIMIKNYDELVEMNHNPNCPDFSYHAYMIVIIGGSASGKFNVLTTLKNASTTR